MQMRLGLLCLHYWHSRMIIIFSTVFPRCDIWWEENAAYYWCFGLDPGILQGARSFALSSTLWSIIPDSPVQMVWDFDQVVGDKLGHKITLRESCYTAAYLSWEYCFEKPKHFYKHPLCVRSCHSSVGVFFFFQACRVARLKITKVFSLFLEHVLPLQHIRHILHFYLNFQKF